MPTQPKSKQPYIPLYTGDYLKKTRRLTLEVRGAWVDLLIFMWESESKGTLTGQIEEFALMLGCSAKKADAIISDLKESKICDHELLPGGVIKLTSRRMVRDEEISRTRKLSGSKGGNPNLVNQPPTKNKNNGYLISDNEYDSGIHNQKELEKIQRFDSSLEYYSNGQQAFEDVRNDEKMVERMLRTVKISGFPACDEITLMKAVRWFVTSEEAKPEFTSRGRNEFKNHVVNWVRNKAKTLNQYG